MPDDYDEQPLLEVDSSVSDSSISGRPAPVVGKTFRAFDPGQSFLLPPSLDDWLPAEHLARFIAELVDEHLDLSRIHASYRTAKGARRTTRG